MVEKIKQDDYQVPDDAINALARCLLPMIQTYYESEEGKQEFAEWKAKQHTKNQSAPTKQKMAS